MLHTNLEKNKRKLKSKKNEVIKVLTVASISVVLLCLGSRLFAASSISWNFDTANDYAVSDSNKIEVTDGEAKLKMVESSVDDDTDTEFNAGSYLNSQSNNNTLSLANTGFSNVANTPGLIAQWRFEDDYNDSKNVHNGTPVGDVNLNNAGKVGAHAITLDGNGDLVNVGNSTSLDLAFPFTISAWIYKNGSGLESVYSNGRIDGVNTYYGVNLVITDTTIDFTYATGAGGGGAHRRSKVATLNNFAGSWHHITVVAKGSNDINIYFDGINAGGVYGGTGVALGYGGTSFPTLIGAMSSTSGSGYEDFFNGMIDEVEVYNIDLNESQIYRNYQKGAALYGEYTSRVIDTHAAQGVDWQNFSWIPKAPYGKNLPNNGLLETGYAEGNVSMSNNLALWHFDNNALDSSGNNKDGAIAGNTAFVSDSKFGNGSAYFDGNGDYISLGNNAMGNPGTNFTLSAWVKVGDTSTTRVIISEYRTSVCGDSMWAVTASGTLYYNNGASASNYTAASIEDNLWHHVAYVYNGSTGRHYVDGVAQPDSSPANWQNTCSGYDVRIGATSSNTNYMLGNIDEFAMFTKALTQSDITSLYSRGAASLNFQARSCNDEDCTGESFVGPDGTSNTFYSEFLNQTTGKPSFDLSSISDSQYFQYKAILSSSSVSIKPEINTVSYSFEGFPTDEPNVALTQSNDLDVVPASFGAFCEGTLDVNNNCTTTSTKPAGTEIYHQICNDTVSNCNTNNTWKYWDGDSWDNANSTQYNTATEINSNIATFLPTTKYFAFKSFLSSGGQSTPILTDVSISVVLDSTAPSSNATDINVNGENSGAWTKNKPTIEWTSGEDNQDGIGLLGYCVSLDESNLNTTQNLNPAISGGVLQGLDDGVTQNHCPYIATGTSLNLNSITGLSLVTNKEYNFSIKAVDLSGNIWSGASGDYQDLYTFKYDGTAPTNPAFISMPSNFISTKDVTITWPTGGSDGAQDVGSGLAGLQYRIEQSGTWYGDLHNGNQDLTDLLVNDGTYTTDIDVDYPNLINGSNIIYFRTIDNAGNVSNSNVTGVLKINTTAPGQVQNLQVSPADNILNAYSFSWSQPDTFIGAANGLTYCYTINTLPNANNCTYTASGITNIPTDAYATQPGTNNFYVVAKDEANNINYDTYSSVEFTYSGEAPGIPLNVDVSDLSVKETQDWKLAVTWATPTNIGAGISSYKVFRSIDQNAACNVNMNNFTQVSSVLGTSFIDTDLSQQDYYYCVKACDSANNCSAVSTTQSNFPTGKYTSPASLTSGPVVNATTTRKAVISWTTDRRSDSKIQIGLSSNEYFEAESGISAQVSAHTITLDNLVAGTTYYYRAKWTDEDGNTGISEEKTFTTSPAPTITDALASRVGIDSAFIQFTSKDAYRVNVYYGITASFGGLKQLETSTTESSYTTILENLSDNSKYFYKVNPVDAEGFEYEGTILSFNTLPRPTVSSIQIEEVKNVAQPTVKVNWVSNTEISSILTFYPEGNEDQSRDSVDLDLLTNHEMQLVGLKAETRYVLFVKGIDKLGNEAISSPQMFTTAIDTRPPQITNVKVEAINPDSSETTSQIIVSWETDELATSQVEYGEGTTGSYSQSTQVDKNLGYKHVVIITNLKPASVYHLKAISEDNSKNTSETSNIVTITPKQQETAFDIVLKGLSDIFSFL